MSTSAKIQISLWGLVLVAIGTVFLWRQFQPRIDAQENPPHVVVAEDTGFQVPEFNLIDSRGDVFRSEEMKGKIWVVSFFYSDCPGPCLILNHRIAELQRELEDIPIRFVSITANPEVDTPEKLAEYASNYEPLPGWHFLTGDAEKITRLAQEGFRVVAGMTNSDPDAEHKIVHSDRLILIDAQGEIRGYYSALDEVKMAMFKRKVKQLVEEG